MAKFVHKLPPDSYVCTEKTAWPGENRLRRTEIAASNWKSGLSTAARAPDAGSNGGRGCSDPLTDRQRQRGCVMPAPTRPGGRRPAQPTSTSALEPYPRSSADRMAPTCSPTWPGVAPSRTERIKAEATTTPSACSAAASACTGARCRNPSGRACRSPPSAAWPARQSFRRGSGVRPSRPSS